MSLYVPEPRFQMRVISLQKSPLVRQLEEGQLINTYAGDIQPNRKGEWGNNLPPLITIEDTKGGGKRKSGDQNQQGGNPIPKRQRSQEVNQSAQETVQQVAQVEGAKEVIIGSRAATQRERSGTRSVIERETQRGATQLKPKVRLTIKQMLERIGQTGERKRDSRRQGLPEDRASGDTELRNLTGTEVDRNTTDKESNNSGELGHSDLGQNTSSVGQIGAKEVQIKVRVHSNEGSGGYISGQIPSKVHNQPKVTSNEVEN